MGKTKISILFLALLMFVSCSSTAQTTFSSLEQQQISIATPGLFSQSDAFTVDFSAYGTRDYCFPLPVGVVESNNDNVLIISTKKGDAVKAMFDGVVRMSWSHPTYGNVIVIRHDNGLETVYAHNRENRVKVGTAVHAGQTIAIVGGTGAHTYCEFSVMVNGGRINPATLIALKSHRLLRQILLFQKKGFSVEMSVVEPDPWNEDLPNQKPRQASTTAPQRSIPKSDPFKKGNKFTVDLTSMDDSEWCYPLAGAKVISAYGHRGGRAHSGVDLKTRAHDDILAAFDGEVVMSQVFSGYGNCIVLRHVNGLETLYSHNSKNLVKVGDHVRAGQVIALTGRTGRATTEHLHFEVRVNGKHYDPQILFDHVTKKLKKRKLTFTKGGGVTYK